MITTRFAPTISGEIHIGGLYNALLNYLYAKKNGGSFNLRLDGLDLNPPHDMWQQNIARDLELFGLHPDRTIKASDRIEYYKEVARDLEQKCSRSYHCDCTVQDLLKRAREGSKFYHLYRPEKYPPYCKVAGIIVRGPESDMSLSTDCRVEASHNSAERPISSVVNRGFDNAHYWEPVDVGYLFHPIQPEIVIYLKQECNVCSVETIWRDRPVLKYTISVWKNDQWLLVAMVEKFGKYFVDYKQGMSFPALSSDKQQFATIKADRVKIQILDCPIPVDKPYFYDYHCRDLGKKLDLNHRDTVLRLRSDTSVSRYDVAYWYGRLPNLVLMSPLDDAELKVTHCIRGRDIESWLPLEQQVAVALNVVSRVQIIHGMVRDNQGYKYSKWINSTPIREYLSGGITPDMILSYIARKAKIIETKETLNLDEIVIQFSGQIPMQDIVIDEQKMLEELRR